MVHSIKAKAGCLGRLRKGALESREYLEKQYAVGFEPHGFLRLFNAGNLLLGFARVLGVVALLSYGGLVGERFAVEHNFLAGGVLGYEERVPLEAHQHFFAVTHVNLHPATFLLADFFHNAFGLQVHGIFAAHPGGYVANRNYVLGRKGRAEELSFGGLLLGFGEAAHQQGEAAQEFEGFHGRMWVKYGLKRAQCGRYGCACKRSVSGFTTNILTFCDFSQGAGGGSAGAIAAAFARRLGKVMTN